MPKIHPTAHQGYSEAAQTYAQGRPDYPPEILPWLTDTLSITANKNAVDLGAGTGKFTKLLAQTGANIIAIEPVEAMRAQLTLSLPDVQTLPGTADAIPLDTASADAVLCAQSFHWFATEAVLQEIHRVLKPSGKLGLIWNVRDESVDWVVAITEIITPYEGSAPRFYKGDWRIPFNGRYFTPLEQTNFTYEHVGTPQQVILDRCLSVSFIAALPDDEKTIIANKLQTLIASHPALRQKDTISLPHRTEAYWCSRTAYPKESK